MTSEVEEGPRFTTAGYGRHGSQWVNRYLKTETCKARNFLYAGNFCLYQEYVCNFFQLFSTFEKRAPSLFTVHEFRLTGLAQFPRSRLANLGFLGKKCLHMSSSAGSTTEISVFATVCVGLTSAWLFAPRLDIMFVFRISHEPDRMLVKLSKGEQRVFLICIRFGVKPNTRDSRHFLRQ